MKKKLQQCLLNKEKSLTKLLQIMKLTFFFIILGIFQVTASAYSQKEVLTFKDKNLTMREVFKEVEKQSSFRFFYNDVLTNIDKTVVMASDKMKINDVLNDLLVNTDLSYKILDNNLIIISPTSLLQQQQKLTGTITDANTGETIIGANVRVEGTSIGTVTDINGKFSLNFPKTNVVVVVTYMGYNSQRVTMNGQKILDIKLVSDITKLDEVVVVGYGSQKREQVTTAIASIKSGNFIKGSVTDASQLIRGKVAGLSVTTPDANPTSVSQINLRGITTLVSGSSPLVLIDGVPGSLITVAPEDIESIDVLKDGSAAAIYGTRGTNGVILITTKKVNGETPLTVELNSYVSTQRITKKLEFMNASQYRQLVAQNKPGAKDYGYETNWLDQIMQTPVSQVHNISLKGGSKNTTYIANLNYRGTEGIIKRSDNKLISSRMEITHNMFNGKLKFNANISGNQQEYFSGSDGGSFNNSVYRNGLTYNPTDRPKDDVGNWVEHVDKTDYMNPLSLLAETHGLNQNSNLRTIGAITFVPFSDFNLKLLGSRDLTNSTRGYYETKSHYSNIHDGKNGYASRGTSRSLEELLELTAQYTKIFNNHQFTGLAGYSWRQSNNQDYYMQNWDFPTDAYDYNNMGAGLALKRGEAVMNSYQSQNKLIGYFARVNYAFRDKYLLMASIRHEGSSKFGENNKWGNFPALSVGWNIYKESFLQDFTPLNNLKLRAGYGITGTEPYSPYMSLNRINFNTYFLSNGKWIQTINPSSNANPDLRWEKKEEVNLGLDYGFLDNRISGSVDLYQRTTKDLLFDYPVSSPPYLYNTLRANAATMENKGVEIQVNAIPVQKKNFQWTTSISFSYNKNKLVSLSDNNFSIASGYFDAGFSGEPMQQNFTRVQIGQPIGNFYGFKTIDIDNEGHWIIEGKDGKPKPILQQQADDKKILGNGSPKQYLSWNNTITYKKLDLNVTMRGAFGFQIVNYPKMQYGVPVMLNRGNLLVTAYDNIYGKRQLADDQSLNYVSYYVENGDYWKIDNITLGYNLDLKSKNIKKVRLYISGSNILTFTKYTGIDPEISSSYGGNGLVPGIDDKNRYPAATTYTLGVFLTF